MCLGWLFAIALAQAAWGASSSSSPCPTAYDDLVITSECTPVFIDVCANDTGNPDPCTVSPTAPDCGGTLSWMGGCLLLFTPPCSFCGVCTFTYTVRDAGGCLSNEATVTVIINGVNECPVAVDDTAMTEENTPIVLDVVMNDYDPDTPGCGGLLDACTVVPFPPDCGGTVGVTPDCRVRFTPPQGFCGLCTFTYTVSDTDGCVSNMATVTVIVNPINDPPVVLDDFARCGAAHCSRSVRCVQRRRSV